MFESWKNTLPSFFDDNPEESDNAHMKNIQELIDIVIDPMITFIRTECQELTPTNDQALLQALFRLWSCLLKNFENAEFTEGLDKRQAIQIVDNMYLFSLIWSVCITCSTSDRRKIDSYLKKVLDGNIEGIAKFQGNKKLLPAKFDKGVIFDYVYDAKDNSWKNWMDDINKDEISNFPKDSKVQDIIVTTVDTVRYSYIQKFCIYNEIPTLFVGPTGTGKSVYIQNVLYN